MVRVPFEVIYHLVEIYPYGPIIFDCRSQDYRDHYEEITIIWKIKIVVSQHQISKSVCQQERYLKSYTKTLRVSPKVSSPYFGPHTQFI